MISEVEKDRGGDGNEVTAVTVVRNRPARYNEVRMRLSIGTFRVPPDERHPCHFDWQ